MTDQAVQVEPHCPQCKCIDVTVNGVRRYPGAVIRYYVCRRCSPRVRWKICYVIPSGGNGTDPEPNRGLD
jgi:hypothetical protein